MFGVIKGCGCHLNRVERQEWVSHVCGLCLTLRDNYGQLSRLATNYDAALLSVLVEAQSPQAMKRTNQVCAIRGRGFQQANVVTSSNAGARYAASLAVVMAAAKLEDHLADGDTWLRFLPYFIRRKAQNWLSARQAPPGLNFETIKAQIQRQTHLEQQPGRDFLFYSRPTELAVGAAFRHTAVLAGCPQNAPLLEQMGRMFGRIMLLLDSYRDYTDDIARNNFNALAQSIAAADIQRQAKLLFQQAQAELERCFHQLTLFSPQLAQKLLLQQLRQVAYSTLAEDVSGDRACALTQANNTQKEKKRKRSSDWCDCCYCGESHHTDTSCCCIPNCCCGDDSPGCCYCGGGDSDGCCGCCGCGDLHCCDCGGSDGCCCNCDGCDCGN
jgi:hypothetical protein